MRIVGDTGMVGQALVGPCPVPSADVRANVVGREVLDHALTEMEAVRYRVGWGIWDIDLTNNWPDNRPDWLVRQSIDQSKETSLETHWWHCNLLVKCDKAYLTFAWAYTGFHSPVRATRASRISSYSQKASLCGHHTSGSQSHYRLFTWWPFK